MARDGFNRVPAFLLVCLGLGLGLARRSMTIAVERQAPA